MKPFRFILIPLLITLFSTAALAQQDTCTPLVDQALAALNENCNALERNSACYGYDRVEATLVDGIEGATFNQPGNITAIEFLTSLRTASFDPDSAEWGVALMRIQAQVPGSLPGANIVFVLMGDVQITNDGSDDDFSTMQSFYFTTGIGQPRCTDAPDRIVVQSPGDAPVAMVINDVSVEITSTAILSTHELDDGTPAFEITMADGEAIIDGRTTVPEGHWAQIPLESPVESEPSTDEMGISESQEAFSFSGVPDDVFCRPVPEADIADFQAMIDRLPPSVLNYPVDTIEVDENGCTGHNNLSAPME